MSSSLSWLDHDAAAASRSLRLLSLFRQPESRDELGIGGIRDAISDQLFPGTSTIQTRLRYAFFIPWLFGQLDARGTSTAKFPGAAREAENLLQAALVNNVPTDMPGVIGRDAGSALKRMPSSVYWAGISTWGLRNFDGTIAQYFGQADQRRARRRLHQTLEENGDVGNIASAWHARLSKLCPEGFPDTADLDLTRDEAEFLLDRWQRRCPNSLLTWLAMDMVRREAAPAPDRIWEHPRSGDFPAHLKQLVLAAQRFDALVHGAALLYNLQLAELEQRDDWIAQHGAALKTWTETQASQLHQFDLATFWPQVVNNGHSISPDTQRFTQDWLAFAMGGHNLVRSPAARHLVEARERRLKGERSRFKNRGARQQWGGSAGLTPLNYRWPIARTFLGEWHAGWGRA